MTRPAGQRPNGTRKLLIDGLRLAASGALLAFVVWQLTDWAELWHTLAQTRPIYLAACVGIFFLGIWISCIKWQLLLRPFGASARLYALMRWYLAGTFAGSFLPSDVGGDLGRGYLADRRIRNHAAVWSSIVAERLTGLAALLLLASATLIFSPALLSWSPFVPLITLAIVALLSVGGWLALSYAARLSWLPNKLRSGLMQAGDAFRTYARHPGALALCLALSLLFHLLSILSLWCVLLALAPETSLRTAFVWPLVSLIGLLPLTPGGLGVREGAQAVLLERAGVDGGVAIAAALLTRMLLWLVAMAGLPALLSELGEWRGPRELRLQPALDAENSPDQRPEESMA